MPSDDFLQFQLRARPRAPAFSRPRAGYQSRFLEKLRDLKYTDRPDIRDRATLEQNFRENFEALNRVHLTDAEFARLLDEIVTPDVFTASTPLRAITSFTRDDGTPLNYSLVNLKDWCKNPSRSSTSSASTPTTATTATTSFS